MVLHSLKQVSNLNLSCKTDLDYCYCFGKVKMCYNNRNTQNRFGCLGVVVEGGMEGGDPCLMDELYWYVLLGHIYM